MVKRIVKKPYTAYRMIKKDGLLIFQIRMLERLYRHMNPGGAVKLHSFAKIEDILKADWSKNHQDKNNPDIKRKESYTINWVMSPPGTGSGGHQNLFRFISYMEKAGHKNNIYLYSTVDPRNMNQIKDVVNDGSFASLKATSSMKWLKNSMTKADAIFATGWETAYPVFNSAVVAKRFYFIQDFEPYFYPVGSEYVLAENTYRFGFHGITAGGWLSKKLHDDYKMKTDHYDFGADKSLYSFTNAEKRKEIFFYARPVTARRGFELGIMALTQFHNKHPEYKINLAGWDVREYEIPFPYENLMSMPLNELSDVYNRCSVALVISLTNMSLLPLELLACGTIPVVNDASNNRLVSDNKYIAYTANNPTALAEQLSNIVTRKELPEYAKKAANSVKDADWDKSGRKFVDIFEKRIING
jgi:glycosyltransferase involved in cell wall biosynthesis